MSDAIATAPAADPAFADPRCDEFLLVNKLPSRAAHRTRLDKN